MKLKRNCLFFNAETGDGGRTPDWGHELGQGKGYLMKEDGCSEIINGLVYNQIKDIENFSYGSGGKNYEMEIISVINSIEIKVYDFQNQVHKTYSIKNPLIAIITKETKGTHIGRRTLKINKGFSYNGFTNKNFYSEINKIITNPWFGYRLSYDFKHSGILTLTIIKAPQPKPIEGKPEIVYETAKERKEIWNDLLNEYSEQYDPIDLLSEPSSSYHTNNTTVINKIYYGAPGTGKSHKVKELLKEKQIPEKQIKRITFHPEYDYASFVGGYKPISEKDSDTGKEEIKYKFVPQTFTNIYVDAWNDTENDYYLVIEEINRGNCAEIFGDIFQLLDRNPEYLITPSNELKEYLEKSLTEKGLENGKMVLPSNLHILATMNTSDQSLFPMDSAFKRRWDWEYVPIDYIESEENPSSKFIVKISETEDFSWIKFIEKVNKEYIQVNPNLGMDKCIGNYFIKAVDNKIELSDFINKAIFYLWNDVFKDEEEHIFEENTFYEDFFPIDTNGEDKVLKMLEKIGLNKPKED